MIVEFVGPPGAGKTTSCACFSELLKSKGLVVAELKDIKKYLRAMSVYGKVLMLMKFIVFKIPSLLFYTVLLALNRIYSLNAIYRFSRLTLFELALKQLKKTRKIDVVLLEQWIIQELWSATIFKLKSYGALGKHLSRFYFNSDAVLYLDVDMHTATERIAGRNTRLSRFDRMDPETRLKELFKYNAYLFELFEHSHCKQKHFFTTYRSPEKNAALFVKHLHIPYSYC